MVLNYIWIFFFIAAFVVALFKLVFDGDTQVFGALMKATFDMSRTGFEISLGLTGVLTFWMGIMKIGERGGAVRVMSRLIHRITGNIGNDSNHFLIQSRKIPNDPGN